jgi:hypothetical protein
MNYPVALCWQNMEMRCCLAAMAGILCGILAFGWGNTLGRHWAEDAVIANSNGRPEPEWVGEIDSDSICCMRNDEKYVESAAFVSHRPHTSKWTVLFGAQNTRFSAGILK